MAITYHSREREMRFQALYGAVDPWRRPPQKSWKRTVHQINQRLLSGNVRLGEGSMKVSLPFSLDERHLDSQPLTVSFRPLLL